MTQIQISPITLNDVHVLRETARQTFHETFHDTNTPENLKAYLDESFSVERLTEELTNPLSRFFFARVHDDVVGYLKTNEGNSQTEFQQKGWFEVERIYVIKQYWGQSIGQTLLDFALKQAAEQKCTTVWLGVWERNYRALRFYQKNGFQPFDRHIFPVGNDPQWDILMKKEI